jgi:hypothetical protein
MGAGPGAYDLGLHLVPERMQPLVIGGVWIRAADRHTRLPKLQFLAPTHMKLLTLAQV